MAGSDPADVGRACEYERQPRVCGCLSTPPAPGQGSATGRCAERNVNRIAVNKPGLPIRIDTSPVTVAVDQLALGNAHNIDRRSTAEVRVYRCRLVGGTGVRHRRLLDHAAVAAIARVGRTGQGDQARRSDSDAAC